MFRESNSVRRPAALKKALFFPAVFALLLISACYQRFERLDVKTTDQGITFSHPEMERAVSEGNLCVFGEISVSRRDAADNPQEEMWSMQNTESGFQPNTEALKKPSLLYGEILPQTRLLTEPKPLREGAYRVNGVIGIYNQKRELLEDLAFNDKFELKPDASGKLSVATVEK